MAYNNEQNDFPLPTNGNQSTSSVEFLPKYFRTDTNKKFVSSTLDQFTTSGVLEKVNAFAGRRYSPITSVTDTFLQDFTDDRQHYQFEPYAVYKDSLDNVEFLKDYTDYIGQIQNLLGTTSNHSLLNSQEFYAWDPHIDWDKLVNFREYYWLPMGPDVIAIYGQSNAVVSTYTVTLANDGNAISYVFSPDGLTRNPTINLYKGQTYRFEINTPGHPIAFATTRLFLDTDPTSDTNYINVSSLYKDGITSASDYVENGVIEFTVPNNAPDVLYYISKTDVNLSGIVNTYNIIDNTTIDVASEIVGKKTYKTSSGIELSNGMKVTFQGTITPAIYQTGNFYVEGVGTAIQLIPESELQIPAIFTSTYSVPFDTDNFDAYPLEDASSFPGTKDYIVINRSSPDRNPWSRYNRWFHKDVITTSAIANNSTPALDQAARATRPIIEFEPGLKLFNNGVKTKKDINLIDTYTTDAFSTVEGSIGYNIDGIDLAEGMRIIFAADTDALVNGKIYEVKFIIFNGNRQITLVETADSVPVFNEIVLVLQGTNYKGKMFWYNGTTWIESQEKISVNQPPLFDLFDSNGISYSDTITYPASNFAGNKIFSYKVGSGTADTELGFSLSYLNIANIGDIVFDFNLLSNYFDYQNTTQETIQVNSDVGYLQKYNNITETTTYVNGWKKAGQSSKQYVIRQYDVLTQLNNFAIDVFDNSGTLSDLEVKVYVNGTIKIATTDYTVQNINNVATIIFNKDLLVDDILVLKCYSVANKNSNGFYEIPANFEKNPLNNNISSFTLGEVNDHFKSITEDLPNFSGSYLGTNNVRDLGSITEYGKHFVQHSGPVNLALYHLTDKNANVIKAIKFARNEYSKFKRRFLQEAEKSGFDGTVKDHVDSIIETIVRDSISYRSFYFSDMIGTNANIRTTHNVDYDGPAYFSLSKTFSLDVLSNNAVYVYRNGTQLLAGADYVFDGAFVNVLTNLTAGDIIDVVEYNTTSGSYIPPTPTKLGLFPKYIPQIVMDSTYSTPQKMIQGHDGSLVLAFNDYRDELLLELEKRIFNNIKVSYDVNKLDIHDFVSSANRNTNYADANINAAMLSDFIQWLKLTGTSDYTSNSNWSLDNTFSYNYTGMTSFDGTELKGYWRSVYKHYFDTDRPHTHPWEMLGFTIKPTWWESVYGPAPYTSGNLLLWQDLSSGLIREPNVPVVKNNKYVRNNLLSIIPVDDSGNLLSPLQAGIVANFNLNYSKNNFYFGDQAPVEAAWRRSSDYPFSLITAWILMQPTKVIGIGFDNSRIKRDIAGNLIYTETNKRIRLEDIVYPAINTNDTLTLTAGLVNYISNYMISNVTANYESYKSQLSGLTNQLGIKLGGFGDKDKLNLVLDSRSPLNTTSVFVPNENYNLILNKSNPLLTVTYSGIIIEKTASGYIISGYDNESPFFTYNAPILSSTDASITIGGISENFVDWSENQEYVIGTNVYYNGKYYKVKITHTSSTSFDASKFIGLASLPIVGGVTASLRKNFNAETSTLYYGEILSSVQDVVDFMLGYENYLKSIGFAFTYYNTDTSQLEDMTLGIKEFMFWVTQNWNAGTVISISPAANQLEFQKNYYEVDNVHDSFYDYTIITGVGTKLTSEYSSIYRDNSTKFGIRPISTVEGIYLSKLPLVQTEHIVLIDNVTVFNDVIYDINTGYRQDRIKVVGFRTDSWNGSLNIPGFVYDKALIKDWQQYTDYAIGDTVKYNEYYYSSNVQHTSSDYFVATNWDRLSSKPTPKLLPNWDYKALEFTDFYNLDTDNFDTTQQALSQHLIGYQPRQYLANIITDSVSQYKFYQGFIQEKGTLNSLTKLFDALSSAGTDSIKFYEEWAFRLGSYGASSNLQELEFKLDESKYRLEPQLFELVSDLTPNRTDLVYELPSYNTILAPTNYNNAPFTLKNDNKIFVNDNGYVRYNDVVGAVNGYDDILNIQTGVIKIGDFVWVVNENNSWNVYKSVQTPYRIHTYSDGLPIGKNIDANGNVLTGFTVYFDTYVDFVEGEIIGFYSSDTTVSNFYKVASVNLTEVGLYYTSDTLTTNFPDSTLISVSRFVKRRFSDVSTLNSNIKDIAGTENDTAWIDDIGTSTWGVYQNKPIFALQDEIINPSIVDNQFAFSIDANQTNTNIIIGVPDIVNGNGSVEIYSRPTESYKLSSFETLYPDTNIDAKSGFGFDVSISSNSEFIAVSAPYASNAKTRYVGPIQVGGSYNIGDIVEDRGTLWKATVSVNNWQNTDGSSLSTQDLSWESVPLLTLDASGTTVEGKAHQGVVYLYQKNTDGTFGLVAGIVSPYPTAGERFGYKVEIRTTSSGYQRLFVGAPGQDSVDRGRIYLFDNSLGYWKFSKDVNYRGIYSDLVNYYTDEIVDYNGNLYQASTNISAGSSLPGVSSAWVDINNSTIEYNGFLPHAEILDNAGDSTIYLRTVNFGENFDVNSYGDILAISSKGYYDILSQNTDLLTERVSIYRNNLGRFEFSQYIDTGDSTEEFGYNIALNDLGDQLAIAAPLNSATTINGGCVYLYNQITVNSKSQFQLGEVLRSQAGELNESFGTHLDFNGNKLAIASKNADAKVPTTFDLYLQTVGKIQIGTDAFGNAIYSNYVNDTTTVETTPTTFDSGNTNFVNTIVDNGRIKLFQKIGDKFIFAEDVEYNRTLGLQGLNNFKLVDNHIYIGLPKLNPKTSFNELLTVNNVSVDSTVGVFADLRSNKNSNSWTQIAYQSEKTDIKKIAKAFLYNFDKNEIITELDVIDPRQGKIASSAEVELSYKTFYDPAVYSINTTNNYGNTVSGIVVDSTNNWGEDKVGKLWWDLSTASWYNPYYGTIQERSTSWNTLTPYATIDVYEWIGTTLLPSEWAKLADTNAGYASGISGLPLYDDNVYSVKRYYDEVSKSFYDKFYYWVKNKKIVPNISNRSISSYDVANLIKNPASQGYRFIALLGENKFALYNCKSLIEGTNTVIHFSFKTNEDLTTNSHTEYQLLTEGINSEVLNSNLEQKWFDSLIGYDLNNNPVPDTHLSVKQKYGIENSPRQTMFVNRIEAVKEFVDRANRILLQNQITDIVSFNKLLSKDPVPLSVTGLWDVSVNTEADLAYVGVAKVSPAYLTPVIENGRIVSVTIDNAGYGYKNAPNIVISDIYGSGAVLETAIDSFGRITNVTVRSTGRYYSSSTKLLVRKFSALVNVDTTISGKWSIYEWSSTSKSWTRLDNQAYDTSQYWNYVDWYSTGYNSLTTINYIVDYTYELNGLNDNVNDIVKVNNVGSGGWILLKKINNLPNVDYTVNYTTVGRQNGTIQLSSKLYDYASTTTGYDAATYDNNFYDREPVYELRYILESLRDEVLIGELSYEYNNLFFASVRYAMKEQLYLDWVFKTSFVTAKHNLGSFKTTLTYQNDNLANYEDYINEVKPYTTKIREYISDYTYVEPTGSMITDFDLSPTYNSVSKKIETSEAILSNGIITGLANQYLQYPYTNWTNNNGYDLIRIDIANAGSGYTQTPVVEISGNSGATATAYLSRGSIKSIVITNPGSKLLEVPTVKINGSTTGTPATAVAILGNGVSKSTHLTMKFDRTSGAYLFTSLSETETFVGSGVETVFNLKWPVSVNSTTYSVYVNGIKQLSSQVAIGNTLDNSKSYDRYLGYIEFASAPAVDAQISISYTKDVSMLSAEDRINFYYNPTSGMAGKDLSQLLSGVEYDGVQINGMDFGSQQGFDASAFGSLPWDTYNSNTQDEIFILDGSTNTFTLSKPLELNVEYNFYLNNVRLDDPNYGTSNPVTNINAALATIIGDGVTTTITIDESLIHTKAGDVVVIRPSTSDGSFALSADSYDVSLQGGALDYSTAAGLSAGDINVDGDGFVTPTTSAGPEELVPGSIVDTLDMKVYHRESDGVGLISVSNYKLDGTVSVFDLPAIPQSAESIIVKKDDVILDSSYYSVDYITNTLTFNDSSVNIGNYLSIMTMGTNGTNIIDSGTFISDGSTLGYVTAGAYSSNISAFVSINGNVAKEGNEYTLVQSTAADKFENRIKILFDSNSIKANDFVVYSVYSTNTITYSNILIDNTFIPDGVSYYHKFDGTNYPVPFNNQPLSPKILVKIDNKILNPGYSISYVTTDSREYAIEGWQFDNILDIDFAEIFVFANNVLLGPNDYTFDRANSSIKLLYNSVAPAGTILDIYIIKNAEYYFVDTEINLINGNTSGLAAGDNIALYSNSLNQTFYGIIKNVSTTSITLQSIRRDVRNAFLNDNQFSVTINGDSTTFNVESVNYVLSDSLSFDVPPVVNSKVEIYQFSNHDVNNFQRLVYTVTKRGDLSPGTDQYINRNLILNGYIKLRGSITSAAYAWVSLNGALLTPEIDYYLVDSLDAIQLVKVPSIGDVIDILQFTNKPIVPRFGFRIFKDMLDRYHYKRLSQSNSFVLAQPLNYYDSRIVLTDATNIFLPDPSKNLPGVLFVEGERIEYFKVSGNNLLQLRRGTLGTGVANVYDAGTRIYSQGTDETINYQDQILTQTEIADGSTNAVEFTLRDYMVPQNVNEIDVYVGGIKLRKNAISIYDHTIALDSPEGDVISDAEFTINGINLLLKNAPPAGVQITIVKKIGKTWNEDGKSLADSNNQISRFLREATIELPK